MLNPLYFIALVLLTTSGCKVHDYTTTPNPISDRSVRSKSIEDSIVVNLLRNLYFGDLHVHTSLSVDAYMLGTLTSSDQAYRFAKGEEIQLQGRKLKLRRPLDFCAITDHAEGLGEMHMIQHEGALGHKAIIPSYVRGIYNADSTLNTKRQQQLFNIGSKRLRNPKELAHPFFFRGYETTAGAWQVHLEATESHYAPNRFTTLAGYEWSLGGGSKHMHRNIIFRDMMVPKFPLSSLELKDEDQLWNWLSDITENGATVMAIPHNSNLSGGGTFTAYDDESDSVNIRRAKLRNQFERVVEVHQEKGNSEVHGLLWKNDEFADFENYTDRDPIEQNYVRYALKKGLEHNEHLGINPFKYGMIGSTDTHNGMAGNTEEVESSSKEDAQAKVDTDWPLDLGKKAYEVVNPGGLVAVWAEANTRGNIYDALSRREAYATSGNRMQVRFFAGYGFEDSYGSHDAMLRDGYEKGVPMGSDLSLIKGQSPEFLIWAGKDPDYATLDRIQVVKGWYDDGVLYEEIFNVVLSDDRKLNEDGSVPDNGATVNMETGEWSSDKGDKELFVDWEDPYFNADVNAFYYLRVLEVPTASWRLLDQIRHGINYPEGAELIIQERAWSSPIWVAP
jgi:hypothetical protein